MEPPRKIIDRIFEFCVILAISAYLLRLAIRWVMETAPYLIIIAATVFVAIIVYRIIEHIKNMGKW